MCTQTEEIVLMEILTVHLISDLSILTNRDTKQYYSPVLVFKINAIELTGKRNPHTNT